MRRKAQKAGRIMTLVISLCMMLMMVLPVMAADEGKNLIATDDPRDSIMLMTLGYESDSGVYTPYKAGTCFLINDEYVLTNKHVVTFQGDELADFRSWENIPDDLKPTDGHVKLYLFVNRDMKVAAKMHDSVNSDDMDFAAVKLSEKIYDRKPIALGDSDQIQTKEPVYAMGFPADSISTKNYNTKDDVSTVDGTVSKITVTGNVDIIEHTAPLNEGNSGGPLLDENNNVIGVNTYIYGKKNYSIQINYIKKGLDTFGIPYVAGSSEPVQKEQPDAKQDEEKEEPEKPDNTAILNELRSALSDAKSADTEKCTEESVKALDDSIGTAEAVLKNENAQAAEIQKATDSLNDAINGLEEKSGPNMMLILLIGAAVVVVIIIIVVVVMSGKKKKAAESKSAGPAPQKWDADSGNRRADNTMPQKPSSYQPPVQDGVGSTTLLDAGTGDTTLLSNAGAGTAYLIRKKNGEKVAVNIQNFKIGKERRKVDYCISDNTSVSRFHCEIVRKGTDYYVVDQGSTNFTFVNGVQLSPHKETLLSDQSILKLSDEEFEFHLS